LVFIALTAQSDMSDFPR